MKTEWDYTDLAESGLNICAVEPNDAMRANLIWYHLGRRLICVIVRRH